MNQHTSFTWDAEAVERLKALQQSGLSASQIGAELGTSRNSVIGKLKRLGLPVIGRPRLANIKQPGPRRNGGAIVAALKSMNRKPPQLPALTQKQKEYILGKPLTIMELKYDTCRWIITDLPKWSEHLYCGNKTVKGLSYCPCHARIACSGSAGRVIEMACERLRGR